MTNTASSTTIARFYSAPESPVLVNFRKKPYSSSMQRVIMGSCLGLLFPHTLFAGQLIDYIRDYDLNDFALGLSYGTSESPYLNTESSNIAFPYLTSLVNPAFTDDWLLISNGNVGFRWVNDNGLVLGAVGRVETLGLGPDRPSELIGLDERKWSWELAPMVGWRAWPVHFNFRAYKEVFGRHGGLTSELKASFPMEWQRGYLVPSIDYIHRDDDFMGYYYGVSEAESNAFRPAYDPGAASNLAADVAWGYRLSDLWLLSGRFGVEWLPDEAKDSPIVDKDSLWSFSVGLAYNADIFQTPDIRNPLMRPRLEVRLGVFQDTSDTGIIRNNLDGLGGDFIDLDDVFGVSRTETLVQTDMVLRLGQYHRFHLGYFELARNSDITLQSDITIGDTAFPAGSQTRATTDTSVTRFSYGYSLFNDAQKEVGVLAGLHLSKVEATVDSEAGPRVSLKTNSPLPVVGAYGTVHLTDRLNVGAQAEVFRMDFDAYDGSVTMINLAMQYQVFRHTALGLGYNYYKVKVNSDNSAINGQITGIHKGPYLSVGLSF